MVHKDLHNVISFSDPSSTEEQAENRLTDNTVVRGVEQVHEPVPGPSSQAEPRQTSSDTDMTWVGKHPISHLRKLQHDDPDIGPILNAKLANTRPKTQDMVSRSPACRHYWILWDSLLVQDGALFKKFVKKDGSGEYLQVLVPKAIKPRHYAQARAYF